MSLLTGTKALVGGIALTSAALILCKSSLAARDAEHVVPLFSSSLPNAATNRLSAVVVDYGPGVKSIRHHHAGSVFAYVLMGAIRSENSSTGPARVYRQGDSFFEPAGSVHLVSENASSTQPAKLLAIFVAPDGARLTTADGPR